MPIAVVTARLVVETASAESRLRRPRRARSLSRGPTLIAAFQTRSNLVARLEVGLLQFLLIERGDQVVNGVLVF